MRDRGEVESIQSAVPEWVLPVVELLTTLGDLSVLLALAALALWVGERDRGAYAFGLILGGLALLVGLKATFSLARPPAELHVIETSTTAFPSGHAMGATVVYGTLALTLERFGTRRHRFVIASTFVVAVSLSRIVLGVHYAADVVAGVAVGAAYLAAVSKATGGNPTRAFELAAILALIGLVAGTVSGPTPYSTCLETACVDRDAFAAVVATSSALLAWLAVDGSSQVDGRAFAAGFAPILVLAPLVVVSNPYVGARGLAVGGVVATVIVASALVRGHSIGSNR